MTTCKKPDRDVPALVCGYPLPCPHHTVVFAEEHAESAVRMMNWLLWHPSVLVSSAAVRTEEGGTFTRVNVTCHAAVGTSREDARIVYRGEREFAIHAPVSAIREAADELTREAHCALEEAIDTYLKTGVMPPRKDSPS